MPYLIPPVQKAKFFNLYKTPVIKYYCDMAAIDLLAKQAGCHANNDITIQTFSVQYKFSKQTSQLKGLNQTVKQRKVKKIKTKKRKKNAAIYFTA